MRTLVVAFVLLASAPLASSAAEWKWRGTYKEAVGRENAGDVVGALSEFESIPLGERDWNTRLHIAGCRLKLGRLLEAKRDYEQIQKDAAGDDATVATAADAVKDVTARIPVVNLTLTPGSTGAVVFLDGVAVKAPSTQQVNPGRHVVEAKRQEKSVFRREIQLTEAMTLDVVVDAPATPGATNATAAPPSAPSSPRDHSSATRSSAPAVVAFTSAGALLIVSAVSFAAWRSADHDVSDGCAQQHALTCDESAAGGSRVSAWRAVTVATGLGAVVGAAVGVVFLPRKESGVSVSIAPGVIRIGGQF